MKPKTLILAAIAIGLTTLALAAPPRANENRIDKARKLIETLRTARLVDEVIAGQAQSESAHAVAPGSSTTGEKRGKSFRASDDGPFSYQLKVYPAYPMQLAVSYFGNDAGKRTFDILINDTPLATQSLTASKPGRFFEIAYPIPTALTDGKRSVTVTFKPHPDHTAGRVFTVATLKKPTPSQARSIRAAQAILDQLKGNITYKLVGDPDNWPKDKRKVITDSMDFAVNLYNEHAYFSKEVRVAYNPKVRTADGNINGSIRFGNSFSKRTALHEISHTLGIGTHWKWNQMLKDGKWTGPRANALVKKFNGPDAVIRGDKSHFWPYGMNYSKEDGAENYVRHVLIVQALCQDMGLLPDHDPPANPRDH